MTSFLYDPYRNSVIGKTSEYSTRVDADTDTLKAIFNDDGTVSAATTTIVFHTTLTTAENPAFAVAETLAGKAVGGVVGGIDADDAVFDGAQILTGSTSVESLVVFKNITNAADSPVLARYDSTGATGLPLTPNGAAVTVVWNASGLWRF